MANKKIDTGIVELVEKLSQGISFEEFAKFQLDINFQPYQKVIASAIENNENMSREEFARKYQLNRMVSFSKSQIITTPLSDKELFNLQVDNSEEYKKEISFTIIDDPLKEDEDRKKELKDKLLTQYLQQLYDPNKED